MLISAISRKNPNAKFEEYGVRAAVALQFSEALTQAHPGQNHFVLDDFFTSVPLPDKLSSMGHHATGTVRKDHIGKAPPEPDDVLRKKERGTFHFQSDDRGNIVCKWHDEVATVASSTAGVSPLSLVNCYFQKKNKRFKFSSRR